MGSDGRLFRQDLAYGRALRDRSMAFRLPEKLAIGGRFLAKSYCKVHLGTMLYTPVELATAIGDRIRARRKAMGLTQADSASRAGVSYRTWRRMEAEGKASIDDLVRAALVLRCEDGLAPLFPQPAATSMDALLRDQRRGRR